MITIPFTSKDNQCFIDQVRLQTALRELKKGEYLLTIKKRVKQRSLNENSYYHGVIVKILSDHTGYTPKEMHECLKLKFLSEEDARTGLVRLRSTSDLSTVEFEQFCVDIRQWSSLELGCYIPLPNEPIDY